MSATSIPSARGDRRTAEHGAVERRTEGGTGGVVRVPASAFVSVRPARPALIVRLRPTMPRHHVLMLILAAALMLMGAMRAHHDPMRRAIVVPSPAADGIEIA